VLLDATTPEIGQELIELGAIDGAARQYLNTAQLLSGTAGLTSVAIVFIDPSGTEAYLRLIEETYSLDADYQPFSVSRVGDETLAYTGEITQNGFVFTAHTLYFRKFNITGNVTTVALVGVANEADVYDFATIAAAKVCSG